MKPDEGRRRREEGRSRRKRRRIRRRVKGKEIKIMKI